MELSATWKMELTHCDGGLFGSKYISQMPGVAADCDDDPDEVYLTSRKREARSRRGLYLEEDKGDGEYVYERPVGQDDPNEWLDRHLAIQARLRREGVLFDMQRALGRDAVVQREALRRRKEEEEREAEAQRDEERKRAKQAKKKAKEDAKKAKGWEHDDYAAGRKSMYTLLLCLKKSKGPNARTLYNICVLKRWIFEHVRDNCFEYKESLVYRLEDFTLANRYMGGFSVWSDPNEMYEHLVARVEEGVDYYQGHLMYPCKKVLPVIRLLESAKRKGWLQYVAQMLAQNVLRNEQVEKADITRFELFKMFYEAINRSYGGTLWTLSTKSRKNMALFRDMRLDGMKEKWPRARHAIRILEVAHEKNPQWLQHLADHAAEIERGKRARAAEYERFAEYDWAMAEW